MTIAASVPRNSPTTGDVRERDNWCPRYMKMAHDKMHNGKETGQNQTRKLSTPSATTSSKYLILFFTRKKTFVYTQVYWHMFSAASPYDAEGRTKCQTPQGRHAPPLHRRKQTTTDTRTRPFLFPPVSQDKIHEHGGSRETHFRSPTFRKLRVMLRSRVPYN